MQPCPYCGETKDFQVECPSPSSWRLYVKCNNCGAIGPSNRPESETPVTDVENLWNKRAPIATLIRSSGIRGCVDVKTFFDVEDAKLYAIAHHGDLNWEPYLIRDDPDGPLTMIEAGVSRKCKHAGWQVELNDESILQVIEQEIHITC